MRMLLLWPWYLVIFYKLDSETLSVSMNLTAFLILSRPMHLLFACIHSFFIFPTETMNRSLRTLSALIKFGDVQAKL